MIRGELAALPAYCQYFGQIDAMIRDAIALVELPHQRYSTFTKVTPFGGGGNTLRDL